MVGPLGGKSHDPTFGKFQDQARVPVYLQLGQPAHTHLCITHKIPLWPGAWKFKYSTQFRGFLNFTNFSNSSMSDPHTCKHSEFEKAAVHCKKCYNFKVYLYMP